MLLVMRNSTLLILNLCVDIVNGVRQFDLEHVGLASPWISAYHHVDTGQGEESTPCNPREYIHLLSQIAYWRRSTTVASGWLVYLPCFGSLC